MNHAIPDESILNSQEIPECYLAVAKSNVTVTNCGSQSIEIIIRLKHLTNHKYFRMSVHFNQFLKT